MSPGHVYDKGKYHDDTIEELGLPEEFAENHTVFFLRWLIEHSLMSDFFEREGGEVLSQFRAGAVPIHEVYRWWDRCLIDEMLSDEGNAFAKSYFEFDGGAYLGDYARALQGDLESEFEIPYSEWNYRTLAAVINTRYAAWRASQPR